MKTKRKAGLDLDGVLYDFYNPLIEFMTNERGYELLDVSDYDIRTWFRGITLRSFEKELSEFGKKDPFLWIPEIKNAKSNILKLNEYYDFYVISHRGWHPEAEKQTEYRLIKDGIPFKGLYITGEKSKLAKKLGLNIFFEDNPKESERIVDETNEKCKVYLIDQQYNEKFDDTKYRKIKRMGWNG